MPSKPKSTKKTSAKTTPVVDTPVVDTPVVDTPVVDTTSGNNVPAVPEIFSYDVEFADLNEQLRTAMTLVKSLTTAVSNLQKKVARDKKIADKKMKTKVKRPKDPNAPPSGFAKPLNVSPALRKFLAIGPDELIARTVVTQRINAYCKEHKLQNEEDKRKIKPDKALKALLKTLGPKDELTFFNLQKYLKPHYPNKEGVFESA